MRSRVHDCARGGARGRPVRCDRKGSENDGHPEELPRQQRSRSRAVRRDPRCRPGDPRRVRALRQAAFGQRRGGPHPDEPERADHARLFRDRERGRSPRRHRGKTRVAVVDRRPPRRRRGARAGAGNEPGPGRREDLGLGPGLGPHPRGVRGTGREDRHGREPAHPARVVPRDREAVPAAAQRGRGHPRPDRPDHRGAQPPARAARPPDGRAQARDLEDRGARPPPRGALARPHRQGAPRRRRRARRARDGRHPHHRHRGQALDGHAQDAERYRRAEDRRHGGAARGCRARPFAGRAARARAGAAPARARPAAGQRVAPDHATGEPGRARRPARRRARALARDRAVGASPSSSSAS